MEAATKDNEIEMASSSSAADSEPNNCSNSEFEKEETMMASSSNNQGKSFNSMGLEHYSAAAEGDFEKFEHSDSKALAKILTPNGNTILHIHITARPRSKISQARPRSKISQNIDFLRGILGKCSDLLWEVNKKGETLLHIAARYGHADVAKFLLEECKKPFQNDQESGIESTRLMLQMTNEARDTALHEAVRYGHLDVVKLLTEEDCELPYDANTVGETPLYLAAERGYADVLDQILTTCTSPADHGPYDRTALHLAVIRKDEDMVERLLQAGERIHKSKQDQQGWTPLHFVAHLGYIEILEKLLITDKSAAYKADNEGKTALHVAADLGRVDIMRELISKCPDCCELVDERGRNVLHFALESKNKKAVKLVLENPWLGNLINEKDKNGNTPLLHAVSIGYYHMIHPKVDIQFFNHQNHNAKDIILGNNTTSWGSEIMADSSPGQRMIVSENDSNIGEGRDKDNTVRSKSIEDGKVEDEGTISSKSNDGKRENRSISNNEDKARENELITATLIATVSFAAGFTVPGGFVADKGPDQGAAILTRNTAFRAFVILNTTSMYFSWQAVYMNLSELIIAPELLRRMPSNLLRKHFNQLIMFFDPSYRQAVILFAMCTMIGAFLSGTYAVLYSDKNLANSACVVPVVMWTFVQFIFVYSRLIKMRSKSNDGKRKDSVMCFPFMQSKGHARMSWAPGQESQV